MKDLKTLMEKALKSLDTLVSDDEDIPPLTWVEAFGYAIVSIIRDLNMDYTSFMHNASAEEIDTLRDLGKKLDDMEDVQYNSKQKH